MQEYTVNSQQSLQAAAADPFYQEGQKYGNGGHYHQEAGGDSVNHLSAQLRSVLDFSRLPSLEEALSPAGEKFTCKSCGHLIMTFNFQGINRLAIWLIVKTLMPAGSPPLPPSPPPLPLFSRCPFTNQVWWSCPSVRYLIQAQLWGLQEAPLDVYRCIHCLCPQGISMDPVFHSGHQSVHICINASPGVLGHLQSTYPPPRLQVASRRWMLYSALPWLP